MLQSTCSALSCRSAASINPFMALCCLVPSLYFLSVATEANARETWMETFVDQAEFVAFVLDPVRAMVRVTVLLGLRLVKKWSWKEKKFSC